MADLWARLPALAQDLVVLILLLLPGLALGAVVLRGYAPWPLVTAMLRRFSGVNLLFIALIAVAVALGVGLTAQERGLRQGSARAAEKFDLIVAAPGSDITMLLAAVYLQPSDVPLLTGAQYAEIVAAPGVAFAAPIAFGDSFEGAPVIGTTGEFIAHLSPLLAEGRAFAGPFEAVAGALAPVTVGGSFTPVHGMEEEALHPDEEEDHDEDHAGGHEGQSFAITGRLAPTGSPWDRAILIPVETVWELHGLANGHAPDETHLGPPFDPAYFPGTPALLVQADTLGATYALQSQFSRPDMMAFFPGTVLAQLHGLMRDVREAMSLLALICEVLVAVAVLAGLFILIRNFARGLAVLRAIGAPARFVFAVVWSYSATLILTGAALGVSLGWAAAAALSAAITARTDVLVTARVTFAEVHLVAGFVSLALLLALVPAISASRRPVLADLRA